MRASQGPVTSRIPTKEHSRPDQASQGTVPRLIGRAPPGTGPARADTSFLSRGLKSNGTLNAPPPATGSTRLSFECRAPPDVDQGREKKEAGIVAGQVEQAARRPGQQGLPPGIRLRPGEQVEPGQHQQHRQGFGKSGVAEDQQLAAEDVQQCGGYRHRQVEPAPSQQEHQAGARPETGAAGQGRGLVLEAEYF